MAQLVSSIVYRIVLVLSSWLKRHASQRWENVVDIVDKGGAPEGGPPFRNRL